MKVRNLAVVFAVAVCIGHGMSYAADYTYSWDSEGKSFLPDPCGRISYKLEDNRFSHLAFTTDEGGTITIEGGDMQFVDRTGFISNMTSGTVVFKNNFTARSISFGTAGAHPNITWDGVRTFLDTNEWITVFEGVNLDDYEPMESAQRYYDSDDTSTRKPISLHWYNAGWTMYPYFVARRPGHLSCQFQALRSSPVVDDRIGRARRLLCAVRVEMRQNGANVEARLASSAYMIWSDEGRLLGLGTDAELADIGDDREERQVFVNREQNSGLGMNFLKMRQIAPASVFRFEGAKAVFTGSATPYYFVRVEIADAKLWESATYPYPMMGSTVAMLDNSATYTWRSSQGEGTMEFATTKPAQESSVTNVITLNRAGEPWSAKPFVVKGIEGYPMVLDIRNGASLPTNGSVTVKAHGILRLSAAGSGSVGLSGGSCEFIVEGGGRLEQANINVFGTNQTVVLNGGKLVLGTDTVADYDLGANLLKLVLRNGAEIISSSTKSFRICRDIRGVNWSVGGICPSTNSVLTQLMAPNGIVSTNIFNVAKTGAYEADFVWEKDLAKYSGGSASPRPYDTNVICKTGTGTMMFNGRFTVPGELVVKEGFVRLGCSGCFEKGAAKIRLAGGGISTVDGTVNDTGDSVILEKDSRIIVGRNASLAFADSSMLRWGDGKKLDIIIPVDGNGEWLGSIRFGAAADSLTEEQLGAVRVNDHPVMLGSNGYLHRIGMILVIR
jgi:hypothetical protein